MSDVARGPGPFPARWAAVAAAAAVALVVAMVLAVAAPAGGGGPPALPWEDIGVRSPAAPADHVGSRACASCHQPQFDAWTSSHHAHAMAAATPRSVLGDFSGVTAEMAGSRGRFYRDGEAFVVETEGRDGKPAAFTVSHTFGLEPLQQYLVTFPDGRVQALPWAWDTRPRESGGQRWFHVYGDEAVPPSDSRHWTRYQQTWNHMCAECHSTAVSKGYDAGANTYQTTWSEVSVGCEACHGAGRAHVAWAEAGADPKQAGKGFAAALTRLAPDRWSIDPATGSPRPVAASPRRDEVETCGRCHARRGQVWAPWVPGRPLADTHLPVLLEPDLFEDDGQMKDEVFNDHSFRQSLMFARGVSCGDCHDPHSGRLRAAGAAVCSQCHEQQRFASREHTGHAPAAGAPDCVSCHMPARTYMVVDRRHDHSFRVPRPDLSVTLGTPNACNDCHQDKPPAWAAAAVERWHGPNRKGHQTYAAAFHAARLQDPAAVRSLAAVARDAATPAVARATAVAGLAAWPTADGEAAAVSALADPDPLVRVAAVRSQEGQPLDVRWRRLGPLANDPVRIVRLAAAAALADQRPETLGPAEREALLRAFGELEASFRLDSDRPEARAGLASFLARRGRTAEAEAELLAALRLEPSAVAVSVNLADLYQRSGREAAAEQVLRAAVSVSPEAAAPRHALGLSLVRSRRSSEAMEHLAAAARLDPGNARFAYVYGVALQSAGQRARAAEVWNDALRRHPSDVSILAALLQQALQGNDLAAAAPLAARLSSLRPDDPELARLAARLRGAR
ncbi:cytochrome c3 family protein [Alsobacter sp. R-9]